MLSSVPFAKVADKMRTGDILLYNCSALLGVDEPQSRALERARKLDKCCNAVPCGLYAGLALSDAQRSCDEAEFADNLGGGEWGDWQHAAVVIRLVDSTDETNPERDASKQIPYALCVNADDRSIELVPARDLLASADHGCLAWRQLMIVANETDGRAAQDYANRSRCSRRRDLIRKELVALCQKLLVLDNRGALAGALSSAMNMPPFGAAAHPNGGLRRSLSKSIVAGDSDLAQLATLFGASPAYLATFALYTAGVSRNAFSASTAARATQDGALLEHNLQHGASLRKSIQVSRHRRVGKLAPQPMQMQRSSAV